MIENSERTEAPGRPVVLRLARYLRVLEKLKGLGLVKVFSNNLGDAVGVTAAMVRKDLSQVGVQGNKRGGYLIDHLLSELRRVLGRDRGREVILIGAGRIGEALLSYRDFEGEGMRIVAAFDSDPGKHREGPPPVLPPDRLSDFVRQRGIRVAIIAVPEAQATTVFEELRSAGIEGVLNFTPVDLKCAAEGLSSSGCTEDCPEGCVVHNVNIGLELENLFYTVHFRKASL